jgi:glycosyltransferase involved in cell wall biosynthesis
LRCYLTKADILVSPRIKGNNTPMKIYSYLHAGRALVATDLPTHRQVLTEDISILAPADPDGFAAALKRLLDDPPLRAAVGERARLKAEDLYTPAAFEAQLHALYEKVQQRISSTIQTTTLSAGEKA